MAGGGLAQQRRTIMGIYVQVGQIFVVRNPELSVQREEWTVIAVDYPQVTFAYVQDNVVDTAYMHYQTAGTVVGHVFKDGPDSLIISFAGDPYANRSLGLELAGGIASHLGSLNPPEWL
jgi:hypothetical protein